MTSTTNSSICYYLGFHSQVHCYVFTCLGAVLSLSCLSLIGVTCHLSRKVKLLKRTKEGSYKRSKTCTHYRLSMRELQEREDAWDEENGFTGFEPMTTIGSAFDTPHHGPTPTSPPPPTKEVIRTDYENEETDRLKRSKRSKEKSYKKSKTSKHYKLSRRERHKKEEELDEENGFTGFEPMTTIGSAFNTPHHGPTPTSPPPPTDEFFHTVYMKEGTDSRPIDYGQTPNVAEPRVKKKIPLKPPQHKTLPGVLGRRRLEDLDDELNNMAAVGPFHTLNFRLDQPDRQTHTGRKDACNNQPDGWNCDPDDGSPYYMGKLSEHQNFRTEANIHGNNMFDVNEILKNANAIEVIQETTSTENIYENMTSLKQDKMPQNFNPTFRHSIESYIDMTASQTLPDGEEYVQMKITLKRSAASEICRKAKLRGISCTSDVL